MPERYGVSPRRQSCFCRETVNSRVSSARHPWAFRRAEKAVETPRDSCMPPRHFSCTAPTASTARQEYRVRLADKHSLRSSCIPAPPFKSSPWTCTIVGAHGVCASFVFVSRRGLEPPRGCPHYPLKVARLPVPPPGQVPPVCPRTQRVTREHAP